MLSTLFETTTLVYLLLLSPSLSFAHSARHPPHLHPRSSSSSASTLPKRLGEPSLGIEFDIPDCAGCQEAVDLASGCVSTGDASISLANCFCTPSLFSALETCLSCQASLDPSILEVAQIETDKLGFTCDAVGIFLPHIELSIPPSTPTSSSARCSSKQPASSSSMSSTQLPSSFSTSASSLLPNATSSTIASDPAPTATPSGFVEGAVSSSPRRTAFVASQFGIGFGAVLTLVALMSWI